MVSMSAVLAALENQFDDSVEIAFTLNSSLLDPIYNDLYDGSTIELGKRAVTVDFRLDFWKTNSDCTGDYGSYKTYDSNDCYALPTGYKYKKLTYMRYTEWLIYFYTNSGCSSSTVEAAIDSSSKYLCLGFDEDLYKGVYQTT